jgi:hypothetical protein
MIRVRCLAPDRRIRPCFDMHSLRGTKDVPPPADTRKNPLAGGPPAGEARRGKKNGALA